MISRENYLQQLIQFKDSDFIKVITGVRRSGKSVLLMQYRDYLLSQQISAENIIYLNFESFDYQWVKNADDFSQLINEKLKGSENKVYLLFDEIQFVDGWQKIINAVRVSFNTDIVITGSNANLLSGELATLLSGRYVAIKIYPLSFREYLLAKQVPVDSRLINIILSMNNTAGFPVLLWQMSL